MSKFLKTSVLAFVLTFFARCATYSPAANKFDWWEAKAYCENLIHYGYTDWRLPTKSELENLLVNYNSNDRNKTILSNKECFSFWTSTSYASYPDHAWYVKTDGNANHLEKYLHFCVRCVRNHRPGGRDSNL